VKAPIVLAGWTVFVWTTRIRNIVTDDSLTGSDRAGRLVLAGSFTVLAAVVIWAWVQRSAALRVSVLLLSGWTVGVWVARTIGIAGGDHSAGFVAVHVVLAVVSVALAALACRHHGPADHRHREAVEQPSGAAVRDQPSPVGDGT
jgi:hypothetical protein